MDGFYLADDGVVEILKDPAAELVYEFQWYDWLRGSDKYWAPRALVKPGDTYTPGAESINGHRYRCTVGGRTGTAAPTWDTAGSTPFADGAVTWVRIGAEDTISSVGAAADTGLTVSAEAVDATGRVTTFALSGGAAGQSYMVTLSVESTQAKIDDRRFRVKVLER